MVSDTDTKLSCTFEMLCERLSNIEGKIDEFEELERRKRDRRDSWIDVKVRGLHYQAIYIDTSLHQSRLTRRYELLDVQLEMGPDRRYKKRVKHSLPGVSTVF